MLRTANFLPAAEACVHMLAGSELANLSYMWTWA